MHLRTDQRQRFAPPKVPNPKLSTNSEFIGTGTGLAYSYLRVSTIKQGDEGEGLIRQGKLIKEFCAWHTSRQLVSSTTRVYPPPAGRTNGKAN